MTTPDKPTPVPLAQKLQDDLRGKEADVNAENASKAATMLESVRDFLAELPSKMADADQNECVCGSIDGAYGCAFCSAHSVLERDIERVENEISVLLDGSSPATGVSSEEQRKKAHEALYGRRRENIRSHPPASPATEPSDTERELRAALEDARSTLMNCGIDNNTPMGLQLRKASGRITTIFDKLDSVV